MVCKNEKLLKSTAFPENKFAYVYFNTITYLETKHNIYRVLRFNNILNNVHVQTICVYKQTRGTRQTACQF